MPTALERTASTISSARSWPRAPISAILEQQQLDNLPARLNTSMLSQLTPYFGTIRIAP